MAIDFPDSPSTNDTYTVNGRTYIWNGEKWLRAQPELTSVVPTLTVSNDFTVDTDTLYVDSTNNKVGIGTTSPNGALDVAGMTVLNELWVTNNLYVDMGSTLTVDSTNNRVGIGTPSPSSQFQVGHNTGITLSDTQHIGTRGLGQMTLGVGSGTALSLDQQNKVSVPGDLTVDTDTLHVDSTNNRVGIGTTSPSEELDVVGDVQVSGRLGIGSGISAELDIKGASNPEIRLQSTDSSDPFLYFGDQVDAVRGGIGMDTSANALQLRGYNNSTRMTIDSTGNVGIGTTSPSAKLDVNGAIASLGSTMLGVRQVLASHKTGVSLTGTTEIDTGLSVTITPKSTSSKILLFWAHAFYLAGNCNLNSRLKRGATQLQLNYAGDWGSAGNGTVNNYYLDSPNTTSAVTYKTTMQSSNTTGVYVSNSSSSSYLLVVEIL